jgi:hypothetical protein
MAAQGQPPAAPAQLVRTGFHAAPQPMATPQPQTMQARQMGQAPVQQPYAPTPYGGAPPQPHYAPAQPQMAPPQMAQAQPIQAPLAMAAPEPMRARLAQSGVHPMAQAMPQAARPAPSFAPQSMAPVATPAQPTLQLASRVGAASHHAAAPAASEPVRAPRASPRASGSTSTGRTVPSPLEGTRFRPRGQVAAARHEPLPTPSAKPTGKLSTALFVAAAVAAGAALTFVAVAFF